MLSLEVRLECVASMYQETKETDMNHAAADTGKKALWKAQGEATNAKPSGPWGAKRTSGDPRRLSSSVALM